MRKNPFKKYLLLVFLYFILLDLLSLSEKDIELAEDKASAISSVKVIKLDIVKPSDYYFTGKVEPVQKVILSFDIPGRLNKILGLGEYVYSPIFDDKGNTVREGTVVASYIKKRVELNFKTQEMAKKAAESQLELANRTLKRIETLVDKQVIAEKFFWEVKTAYTNALINLGIAQNKFEEAKYNLASCTMYSPFSGIICKVNQTLGDWVSEGVSVVEIMKMDPILVKIMLPKEIKSIIRDDSLAFIYPAGVKKPIRSFLKKNNIDMENVFTFLSNYYIQLNDKMDEATELPKIEQVYKVSTLYSNDEVRESTTNNLQSSILVVPLYSIRSDNDGYYVLKALEQDGNMSIDNDLYKLERVNIELGDVLVDKFIDSNTSITTRSLKNPGSLKLGDIIVGRSNYKLTKNDIVILTHGKWLFFPGQLIKVRIPALNRSGYYVPINSIIYQGENDTFVYLAKNSKAILTKVRIVGFNGSYYSIIGKGIVSGEKVVVFKDSNQLASLYDGKSLSITKVLPVPNFLESKQAFELKDASLKDENDN